MSIDLNDEVRWTASGEIGTVIGLTTEPSAIVQMSNRQLTIALSKLELMQRSTPVPPLPKAPYTVIRATWKRGARTGATDELAFFGGDWIDVDGAPYAPWDLQDRISGYEVLSEPRWDGQTRTEVIERVRREAVKTVLDRAKFEMSETGLVSVPGLVHWFEEGPGS